VRKTRYHGYPDLVCTDGQMWIRRYQEVMEQSHVSHGLISLDAICEMLKHANYSRIRQVSNADLPVPEDAARKVIVVWFG
jgi:hypothetical protein